jgi:hypothetical protein
LNLQGRVCLQIQAPHFSAGVILQDGKVADAAPILRYMKGWYMSEVSSYCMKKRWTILRVDELKPEEMQ